MAPILALLSLFWLADPAPVKGVPPPPGGKFEAHFLPGDDLGGLAGSTSRR